MTRLLIYVGSDPSERYALCADCSRKATGFDAVQKPVEAGTEMACEDCGKKGRVDESIATDQSTPNP